jgi:hypothetical protein
MPGMTAEASIYRRSAYYAMLADIQQDGEVLVHPALRFFFGLKTACFEFATDAFICCEGSFCYQGRVREM